jgi:hypothetical protein
MADFWSITIGDVLGSGVVASLIGFLLVRRTTSIERQIGEGFDRRMKVFESTRAWREQALFELFGPVVGQLRRTDAAFKRWSKRDLGLEAKVIREGNLAIRDLLLAKGHLIPPKLQPHAGALITHYDAWLLKFDQLRGPTPSDAAFVFVGPDGYPFPRKAQDAFEAELAELLKELYGSEEARAARSSDRRDESTGTAPMA